MNPTPHRPCPDDEVLQELAAGISSPELAEQTMQHVSRCSICGPALQRYVREFSAEETLENTRILERLESSKTNWQRRLVKKLLGRPGRITWLKMVPALAGLAVAILAVVEGPVLLADLQVKKAQSQAAAAFADRRTTEMRLTSVTYSPYKPFPTELGANGSRELDEMPSELTSASSAANENLKKDKVDPRWLQVQGRALLWSSTSGSLERAEKDFEKARSEGLDTPSLEIDLAASYFERDSRADHPNLQRSLNLLNEVLSKPKLSTEDRASALYNLAIALEKSEQLDRAEVIWEDYLKVDSSSGWAQDARRHLEAIKAKKPASHSKNYDSPGSFLGQLDQNNFQPEDLEQYQQKALGLWLPAALNDKNNEAYRAVTILSGMLAEQHSDFWLREFLAKAPTGTSVEFLSAAVIANEKGLHGPAVEKAKLAERLFTEQKNIPGRLFAQFQEVYGTRSLLQAGECLARADPLWEELSRTRYRWLQSQVALERAQCENFAGDLAASDSNSKISLGLAENLHFPVLELRVWGISAAMQSQQGRCDAAWNQGIQGLKRYWQGNYPRDRLDQFYSVMWQCAEEAGSLYAAESLLQHTIAMRQAAATRNPFREAMLHLRLRNMFLAQKQFALADEEDARAASLLKTIKENDKFDPSEYKLVNDIEPAELLLQQGDPTRALATIRRVGETLKTVQSDFIKISYNRVLASVYRELHQFDEANQAYQTAIGIAEAGLQSLSRGDERLKWLRATDESYRGLVRVLLEQKRDQEALERWEWYQSRPWLQGFHSAGSPQFSLSDVKSGRRRGSDAGSIYPATRLIYANFKDGLQIWTSSSRGVHGTWIQVKQQDFERAVREFAERCSSPDSNIDELREQGEWLYGQMVQPVISQLPESDAVVVELDRSAYNLSVEALTSPAGWYFGEKYAVVYSPGVNMEQGLRSSAPIDARSEVFVLDATRSPGSGFLPGMEAQRSAIARMFPRTRIVDSTSTSWNKLIPELNSSQIFHYLGHGRPDGSGTALAFSGAESLRAKDIAPGVFDRSQLVVLAACSTALGRDNGLLDTNSLVRAFLMAGVPRVVASHWDVDAETTSQLMVNFYQSIANDKSITQAIFHARKAILASHPHPYYWASFSVTGRVS
jgi:CHAT domain-containing protein